MSSASWTLDLLDLDSDFYVIQESKSEVTGKIWLLELQSVNLFLPLVVVTLVLSEGLFLPLVFVPSKALRQKLLLHRPHW